MVSLVKMLNLDETAAPEIFPEAFEIMGQWLDPTTKRIKFWVRFFCTDSQGKQVGRDAFNRFFDAVDFSLFMNSRRLRGALALEPQEDLTPEELERVADILRERAAPQTPSFPQRVRAVLRTIRRKAGGRAVSPVGLDVGLRHDGVLFLKGNQS
jgi:hypothetical protein